MYLDIIMGKQIEPGPKIEELTSGVAAKTGCG